MLFLDRELNVKGFTSELLQLANMRDSDIGRPLSDLRIQVTHDTLLQDIREVLSTRVSKEMAVHGARGGLFDMRITPQWKSVDELEGIVVTFVERQQQPVTAERLGALLNEEPS